MENYQGMGEYFINQDKLSMKANSKKENIMERGNNSIKKEDYDIKENF